MQAEIIATAYYGRELFPIINIRTSLGKAVGLPMGDEMMNVSVYEESAGDLVLARTLPPQFTLSSK